MNIKKLMKSSLLLACCWVMTTVMASTSDGETPAVEGVCDELKTDGITKGLYGLCVAFCEAQDCEATLDESTGEYSFDDCLPSNPKILDNYNKKKTDEDPSMPCVNVTPGECPCWTLSELQGLPTGDLTSACFEDFGVFNQTSLQEKSAFPCQAEATVRSSLNGEMNTCIFRDSISDPGIPRRDFEINQAQRDVCRQEIIDECQARGLLP